MYVLSLCLLVIMVIMLIKAFCVLVAVKLFCKFFKTLCCIPINIVIRALSLVLHKMLTFTGILYLIRFREKGHCGEK